MTEKPTIVLVHGGFHGSWVWSAVERRLRARELETATIDLPSVGRRGETLPGLTADTAALTKLLDELPGRKIILAHSYGGAVMSAAAAGRSDVDHLIYEAAFAPDAGQTVLDVYDPPPTWMGPTDDGAYVEIKTADVVGTLYGNTPADIAAEAGTHLDTVHGIGVVIEPSGGAGWRTISSTYVVSANDQAIDPDLQRRFAQSMNHTVELQTDHSAMLSATNDLVAVIEGVL